MSTTVSSICAAPPLPSRHLSLHNATLSAREPLSPQIFQSASLSVCKPLCPQVSKSASLFVCKPISLRASYPADLSERDTFKARPILSARNSFRLQPFQSAILSNCDPLKPQPSLLRAKNTGR